jgi:hypothetical protein
MAKNTEKGIKIAVTLTHRIYSLLDTMCEAKGLTKSAMITVALDKIAREEGIRAK